MPDLSTRLATLLLLAAGFATVAGASADPAPATLALQHRQVLLSLAGGALLLAPWWPLLRGPAVSAALLAKLTLLLLALTVEAPAIAPGALWGEAAQVLALLAAGAILLREARREARWNGVLPLRQEG
jgi:hypothetical protein